MLRPDQLVLVSVSGGPDSICLLEALHRLRRLLRMELAVFHFDHRLRADSAADAEYVRRAARRLGLPFHLRAAESGPTRDRSPEHWAREVRLSGLLDVFRETRAHRMALGHTRDDQAETVLMAVLRGEGLRGVAGIRPRAGHMIRPLLETTRVEVEAFCRALRLSPRRDPMNRDTHLLRNAVRLQGIPSLERIVGREVRGPLARSGALLREDADELDRQAGRAFGDVARETREGFLLRGGDLLTLPRAIGSRVVVTALLSCGVLPSRENVAAVLDVAAGRPGRTRNLAKGLLVAREGEYVRLSRPSP
jgi:tRNA(Ile)-lysidine synthase